MWKTKNFFDERPIGLANKLADFLNDIKPKDWRITYQDEHYLVIIYKI